MTIADRHAGTLGGRLRALDGRAPVIGLRLDPRSADRISVQHTAWMLTNLLARLEGVISQIVIAGGEAALQERVVPLCDQATTLSQALVEGAAAVDSVPVSTGSLDDADLVLAVGPGDVAADWRVHGEGFCGALSRSPIASVSDSALPFGPYVAACLAAGEVFRYARMRPEDYREMERLSFSLWDHSIGIGTIHEPGQAIGPLELDFGLAGVGAVGCALMHALWAMPQVHGLALIVDADKKGIDLTNLNRCIIFSRLHLGLSKAQAAALVCGSSEIRWQPVDGRYSPSNVPNSPAVLVSAVDTNRSRDQLQQGFWPARLLAASTKDLRAEVIRLGPAGQGPCLRCYNPPEVDLPDDVVREQLRSADASELQRLADVTGHSVELLKRWALEGGCSEVGDAALRRLREEHQEPAMFAVGFVSVLAGTMLAAQLVKEFAQARTPLDDQHQVAKFQFLQPSSPTNGAANQVQRDPHCPACDPEQPAVGVWRARAAGWMSAPAHPA